MASELCIGWTNTPPPQFLKLFYLLTWLSFVEAPIFWNYLKKPHKSDGLVIRIFRDNVWLLLNKCNLSLEIIWPKLASVTGGYRTIHNCTWLYPKLIFKFDLLEKPMTHWISYFLIPFFFPSQCCLNTIEPLRYISICWLLSILIGHLLTKQYI